MNASRILSEKGSEVFTIAPTMTLLDAARELTDRKVGAVVIMEDGGKPQGVFSERDLAREIAGGGASVLTEPVSGVMSRDLVTAGRDATVDELMGLMTDRRVRHILILEDGQLVGVVSIGDVVKRKIAEAEREAESLKQYIESA
ncbi:CBS domain-containing protein [Marinicauda algicola]|uniref:CBS domain-containing protein n=1 Tax=Marinicauda algicola TaxID=2029849 RepID=A0A4S2GYT6_9PROT|nr:CBS domain-containing protein [Marinicauda algicola]TGY88243.1 CBS domain-containing protein [Marinicauda algicola]